MNSQQIALQIAEKLREIATRQGTVPFKTGDLRKSHVTNPYGTSGAILSANTPYARAVHDGRKAITIRPKRGKALSWRGARHPVRVVHQPARKGNPWLRNSIGTLDNEGLSFLQPTLGAQLAKDLERALRKSPHIKLN